MQGCDYLSRLSVGVGARSAFFYLLCSLLTSTMEMFYLSSDTVIYAPVHCAEQTQIGRSFFASIVCQLRYVMFMPQSKVPDPTSWILFRKTKQIMAQSYAPFSFCDRQNVWLSTRLWPALASLAFYLLLCFRVGVCPKALFCVTYYFYEKSIKFFFKNKAKHKTLNLSMVKKHV